MAVKILYVELRTYAPRFERFVIDWWAGLTAQGALELALGSPVVKQIEQDLEHNARDLTVAWRNEELDEGSDIGGVGSLEWEIQDRSIVVVTYENENTSDEVEELAIAWMLEDEAIPW